MIFRYKVVLFLILLVLLPWSASAEESIEVMGVGVGFTADKTTFSPGEDIRMTLRIFNTTGEDITFHFQSAQRYDFSVTDEARKILWRWSEDRAFAMVLGREVLGPGRSDIVYTGVYKGLLHPGVYRLTGTFIAKRPLSASVTIEVK